MRAKRRFAAGALAAGLCLTLRVGADPVSVTNPSFEQAPGDKTSAPGWIGGWVDPGQNWLPTAEDGKTYLRLAYDGSNYNNPTATQETTYILKEGDSITVTVAIGNDNYGPNQKTSDYTDMVSIMAHGIVVASYKGSDDESLTPNGWLDVNVTYKVTAADAGKHLGVQFGKQAGWQGQGPTINRYFDNVRITVHPQGSP